MDRMLTHIQPPTVQTKILQISHKNKQLSQSTERCYFNTPPMPSVTVETTKRPYGNRNAHASPFFAALRFFVVAFRHLSGLGLLGTWLGYRRKERAPANCCLTKQDVRRTLSYVPQSCQARRTRIGPHFFSLINSHSSLYNSFSSFTTSVGFASTPPPRKSPLSHNSTEAAHT